MVNAIDTAVREAGKLHGHSPTVVDARVNPISKLKTLNKAVSELICEWLWRRRQRCRQRSGKLLSSNGPPVGAIATPGLPSRSVTNRCVSSSDAGSERSVASTGSVSGTYTRGVSAGTYTGEPLNPSSSSIASRSVARASYTPPLTLAAMNRSGVRKYVRTPANTPVAPSAIRTVRASTNTAPAASPIKPTPSSPSAE